MDLLRDWKRRIVGGTAAIVMVPVVVVAAALSIGLGGGLRGIASLGQALTGPQIPGVEPAAARGRDSDDANSELLADATVPVSGATAAPTPAAVRRRAARRRRSSRRDRPAATPTPDATRPPSSGSGGGGGGGEPAPPPPPDDPSTVRQVGDEIKKVTDQVPIAGEPAGAVIDTIVETAEQLPLPNLPTLP